MGHSTPRSRGTDRRRATARGWPGRWYLAGFRAHSYHRVIHRIGGEVLGKGIKAGTIGFAFVMLFMLLWYRIPGLVATISLLFYVIAMLALFQVIPSLME